MLSGDILKKMRTTLFILTFLFFASCSVNKNLTHEQLFGKYRRNPIYGVSNSIELKSDLTFIYDWQAGLMNGRTYGKWEVNGNRIVLNSEQKPPEYNYEVLKINSLNSDTLTIKIYNAEGMEMPFANCLLKVGATTLINASSDSTGEMNFPRINTADSLIIKYLGYKTIRYHIENSEFDYIFHMKDEITNIRYFSNETWIFKRDRLYDPLFKWHFYDRKNYYIKIK